MAIKTKKVSAQKVHAGTRYGIGANSRMAFTTGWQWVVYGDDGFPIDASNFLLPTKKQAIEAGNRVMNAAAK